MPITVKHFKVSDKADGQDPTLLQPSDWNEDHVFKVEPKKLVGNSTGSLADADNISISDDFTLEDGLLSLGSNFEDAEVVVSVDTDDFPGARVLTSTPTVAWDFATAAQAKANVPDAGITLAKMELGPVGGEILYYDKTSKAPVRLPYGSKGMVLKTGTAAIVGPPAVAATNPAWGFSGPPHAIIREQQATGVKSHNGPTFAAGWHNRFINTEVYDTYDFVTFADATNSNVVFKLGIGTWYIEWSCPARECRSHQTRLHNNTDAANPVVYGTSEYSDLDNPTQSRSIGAAQVTVTVATDYVVQHFAEISGGSFGIPTGSALSSIEVYTVVKIWRVA